MTPGRRYAGRTTPERQDDRRKRLLAAGLELFGTLGWAGGTVERLCAEAGVATRSFYEEFDGRGEVLLAVYAQILDGAAAAVRAAVAAAPLELRERTRAGLAAYVGHLTADPRRARVAHVEVRAAGSGFEPERRAAVVGFARLIEEEGRRLVQAGQCRPDVTPLTALALAGAVNELLVDWATTVPHPASEPLVAEVVGLFVSTLSPRRGDG